MELHKLIDENVNDIHSQVVSLRRSIHEHPELGLKAFKTAQIIAEFLKKDDIPFKSGVGRSGILALIEGRMPGPCVLLRADMDGLPLQETTGLEFASKIPGKMHACGHDLHAGALAGTARILWRLKDRFKGTCKLMFQPGEETLSGAKAMIEDGVLDAPIPQSALSFHNSTRLKTGTIGYRPVVSFAGSQAFTVIFTGSSGHGAQPHKAIDSITAAANFIMQLQSIVSREVSPVKPAVVSVGRIEGGTANNIIAETVAIRGIIRSQDPTILSLIREAINRLLDGIAKGMRVETKIVFGDQVPPLLNDKSILDKVLGSAQSFLDQCNIIKMPEDSMGAEDFSYISRVVPSSYLMIGSRIPGSEMQSPHRSDFLPDEDFLRVALRLLPRVAIALGR